LLANNKARAEHEDKVCDIADQTMCLVAEELQAQGLP
jgi:hypothetical protein